MKRRSLKNKHEIEPDVWEIIFEAPVEITIRILIHDIDRGRVGLMFHSFGVSMSYSVFG